MQYDAIVIGGSFAGLSAAMQLARANRRVCVIDSGSPRNRFAVESHGLFGRDGARPGQMIDDARRQLAVYPSVSFVDGEAIEAGADAGGYAVTLAGGARLLARMLVLAFGLEDLLPELPGIAERWGQTVLHCPYCHGYEFLDRPQGVLNILPISIHQAEVIRDWGPTVFFLDGGPMPDDAACAGLAARNVTLETARVVGLEGQAPHIAGVRLADGRLVETAVLYLATPTRLRSAIAGQLGSAFEDGPFGKVIATDAARMTSVPGVYAAGDIARVPQNATFASADGVQAGMSAHQALIFGGT